MEAKLPESTLIAHAPHQTPHITLPSGQRVYALLRGALPAAEVAALPVSQLRPELFTATPEEVAGFASMSKSALQRALVELRWEKLRTERARRRAARALLEPSGGQGGDTLGGGSGDDGGAGAAAATTDDVARPPPRSKRPRSPLPDADADGPPPPLIVVDCAFEALMTATERASLSQQLAHSYAAVKRGRPSACALSFVGLGDVCAEQLLRISGVAAWRMAATQAPLERVFAGACSAAAASDAQQVVAAGDSCNKCAVVTSSGAVAGAGSGNPGVPAAPPPPIKGCGIGAAPSAAACALLPPRSLVYLSADAPRVLWRLERGAAYVVGGLVDRNRHKGACAAKAAALGLPTARLPLEAAGAGGPGAAGSRRARVLTTNKVVEVLAAVAAGGGGGGGGAGVGGAAGGGGGGGVCAEADAEGPPSAELVAVWAQALRDALGTHDASDS